MVASRAAPFPVPASARSDPPAGAQIVYRVTRYIVHHVYNNQKICQYFFVDFCGRSQVTLKLSMRIGELVKQTGVPKETIHFYLREGLIRKPRRSGTHTADYTAAHVDRILLIKELRDSFFLPIPEIKKILKRNRRQSPSEQAVSDLHNKYFRPLDRLLATEVVGRDAFRQATGIGRKWLAAMEDWGIISAQVKNGEPVYSRDDLIIGRLMVDMDRLGFGPKNGYDPEELKRIADFIRRFVRSSHREYYHHSLQRLSSTELDEKGSKFVEIMSLFFYHLYRKLVREEFHGLRRHGGRRKPRDPSKPPTHQKGLP
jgi:DNA-binding transcriptional MerR regulator